MSLLEYKYPNTIIKALYPTLHQFNNSLGLYFTFAWISPGPAVGTRKQGLEINVVPCTETMSSSTLISALMQSNEEEDRRRERRFSLSMCKEFQAGMDMEDAEEYELLSTPSHVPFPFEKQLVGW